MAPWHSGPLSCLRMTFGSGEDASAWIGRVTERAAATEVSRSMTLSYCALVEDGNPRYWRDGESPPGLLQVFACPLPWSPDAEPPPYMLALEVPLPGTHIINVSNETVYEARHHVGDRIDVRETIVDVSEPRETRLGVGHFITSESVYSVGPKTVATVRNVLLRYAEAA